MTVVKSTDVKSRDLVLAWALLVVLTAVSWWLGADHGGLAVAAATTVVLVVSFVKVSIIGSTFMELGHAAPLLRVLFFGLTTVIGATLVGIYLTV